MEYKLFKDCQDGEWVYHECGDLAQVKCTEFGKNLHDGYVISSKPYDYKVYPISLDAKKVAEYVNSQYQRLYNNDLIRGGRWSSWLSERMDELMAVYDDNSKEEEYFKIKQHIEQTIGDLIRRKKALDKEYKSLY